MATMAATLVPATSAFGVTKNQSTFRFTQELYNGGVAKLKTSATRTERSLAGTHIHTAMTLFLFVRQSLPGFCMAFVP